MVQAFIPSIAVLLLGTIGLLSDDTAVWLAIAVGLAALLLWSLEIGRRERLSPLELAEMGLVNGLFGAAVILLKVVVH